MSKDREHRLQVACVRWFRLQYKGSLIWATPNGGQRNAITAAKLKVEGVASGVPDLFIPIPNTRHSGLFIELKIKPNKPTVNQKEMMLKLHSNGYKCAVCYSIDEFISMVNEYMNEI